MSVLLYVIIFLYSLIHTSFIEPISYPNIRHKTFFSSNEEKNNKIHIFLLYICIL